jgi:ribonuclease HII
MICGVDEAGRGPVFGPLIIAGVTFEDDTQLVELNVRDSKKITPARRKILAKKIKELAVTYEIISISASDIDDMRNAITLNEIELNVFSQIIKRLKPTICYVDSADVNDTRFGEAIASKLPFKTKIISKHRADEMYPIVGAASIIAKVKRDAAVHTIETALKQKLNLPLGSGYPADPVTKKFLKTWTERFGELPPYTRHSWKTAQKALNDAKIKKLDTF